MLITQCWFNAGPTSRTLVTQCTRHWSNIKAALYKGVVSVEYHPSRHKTLNQWWANNKTTLVDRLVSAGVVPYRNADCLVGRLQCVLPVDTSTFSTTVISGPVWVEVPCHQWVLTAAWISQPTYRPEGDNIPGRSHLSDGIQTHVGGSLYLKSITLKWIHSYNILSGAGGTIYSSTQIRNNRIYNTVSDNIR